MSKTADEKKDARLNSGVGAGVFGLCSNAVLFALKTAAGVLSGSITVVADAVNNLSDAGGSALTLAGFRLAARPADREHPFGHARYEYITTLVLSLLVFAVGAVLCYTSVSAVIDPEPLTASAFSYAVLGVAMGVKAVQAAVYLVLARRINSGTLRAAALDSLTDILATGAALASTVVADKAGVNIDGWTGIAVSLFVMIMAGKSAAGAVSPLLGARPPAGLEEKLRSEVLSAPGAVGMHDLEMHGYGEGRFFAVAHLEVPSEMSLREAHELADGIERAVLEKLGVRLTLHTDPVELGNDELDEAKARVEAALAVLDPGITIHDFRLYTGADGVRRASFDAAVPYESDVTRKSVEEAAGEALGGAELSVNIDRK